MAFLYTWGYLFLYRPGANAIKCLTFGRYVLQPLFSTCSPPSAVMVLALLFGFTLVAINCGSLRFAARWQQLFTAISLVGLATLAALGIWTLCRGKVEHLYDPFEGTSSNVADVILGWYSGIFAFVGYNALNFVTEDVKNPAKTLPRAIYLSLAIVSVLYLLVNLAYFTVLGKDGVMASSAVAVTFGSALLGPASWIITIFIVASNTGSFNSAVLTSSRLALVGARSGHLPQVLSLVTAESRSPITAVIVHGILVAFLVAVVDLYSLLKNIMFMNSLFDGLCVAGLLYLRHKRPDLHRPLKVPYIFPLVFCLLSLVIVAVPLLYRPQKCALSLALLLSTGLPYYFFNWYTRRHSIHLRVTYHLTAIVQKLFKAVNCRLEDETDTE